MTGEKDKPKKKCMKNQNGRKNKNKLIKKRAKNDEEKNYRKSGQTIEIMERIYNYIRLGYPKIW